jgi:hypothetical protein
LELVVNWYEKWIDFFKYFWKNFNLKICNSFMKDKIQIKNLIKFKRDWLIERRTLRKDEVIEREKFIEKFKIFKRMK